MAIVPPILRLFYLLRKLCLQRFHSGEQRSTGLPEHGRQPTVIEGEDLALGAALAVAVRGCPHEPAKQRRRCIPNLLRNKADPFFPGLQIDSLVGPCADIPEHLKAGFAESSRFLVNRKISKVTWMDICLREVTLDDLSKHLLGVGQVTTYVNYLFVLEWPQMITRSCKLCIN